MRKLTIIAILLLGSGHLMITTAQQINIRRYSIEDGLVNNDINNIFQDSRGFIWLCTRGGLSLYDGSRFTNFTTSNGLTHDMINDIFEIAPQQFIVAQNAGGPQLLKNERMAPLVPGNMAVVNKFYPLPNNRLIAAADSVGAVEFDKDEIRTLKSDFNNSIAEISPLNDSVWLVSDLNFYAHLTTATLQPRCPKQALGATSLLTDSKQRTWMGTIHGLKLLDPSVQFGKSISTIPLPAAFDLPILHQAYIMDIMEDSQGSMWIGTMNGLVKIDSSGRSNIYTLQDGLPAMMVNCIIQDRQNNIWIGTPLGLAKFRLSNDINLFSLNLGFSHDGGFAISPTSNTKLRLFDGETMRHFDLLTGKTTSVSKLTGANSHIIKLSPRETVIRKGKKGLIYRTGVEKVDTIDWPNQYFTAITRTGPNQFLTADHKGFYAVDEGRIKDLLTMQSRSPVYALLFDRKNFLWAGTWENGLVKMSYIDHELKIVDTISARLPDSHVRSMYTDRENEIWVGTRYKGIVRVQELPNGKYEIQQYGTSEGLSSDFVFCINRDASGNIWVGTAQGLDKLIPEGNRFRVFNYGKVNKMFSKVVEIYLLENNFMVANGYPTVIYARDFQQDALPPLPVYITKISGGPADSSYVHSASVKLPYDRAQIYFEFSAPEFINEDFTKYSYRLIGGNDTAWNIAGTSRNVYFANLRPGQYSFQVRALGFNGKWGAAATYGFVVKAPFWQKPVFIVLVVLALGFLIYTLYRYRVHQLIRLQKVRNRIATDLHDEIGSNLTNISILSNLSKKNILQPQKAGDFLTRISEEVSSSSQALDDIIWSVNANHDTLEETVARMRRYAAELFDSANTRYELYLDPAFEGRRLTMEQRRDLYLLYKEAVNNISKHAAAKNVAIQIAIVSNHLLLSVKDDGNGFDMKKETNRYGLRGMKERVKKWRGKITVESAVGRGTFIQVRLPVSK